MPMFFRFKTFLCVSSSLQGISKESRSLLCRALPWPVLLHVFLTRMICYFQNCQVRMPSSSDSRVITGCLSCYLCLFFLFEACLSFVRFILINFALSFYEDALRLLTSFSSSSLGNHEEKTKTLELLYRNLCFHSFA